MKLKNSNYKVIINLTELQNVLSKNNMTLEQFNRLWNDLEPIMSVVEKPDNLNREYKENC